jgi:hypothetical protein
MLTTVSGQTNSGNPTTEYTKMRLPFHRRETMWQLHAAFRFGDYWTPELDLTPVVGIMLIAAVLGLVIQTGL